MARIFIVEDNENLAEAISSYLALEEHETVVFHRLAGVREALRMNPPGLIILDVMLPDGDGFHFARQLRADRARSESNIPIVFLTARATESDRIIGFEIGADDYVVKPFSTRELVLRVRAVLRRSGGRGAPSGGARRWTLDAPGNPELILDGGAHRAWHAGEEVVLTGAEWKILEYLAGHEGMVVARERLLGACLDYIAEGSERTIDTHVKNIRAKLGRAGWIETVRGFGYRFAGRGGKP